MEEKGEEDVVMITWKMEVRRHSNIGRPKRRWSDVIREDKKEKRVKIEETHDRRPWRLTTRRADPNIRRKAV